MGRPNFDAPEGLLDIGDCIDERGEIAMPPGTTLISLIDRNVANIPQTVAYRFLDFARSHDGRHADLVSLSGGIGLTETYVEAALSAGCPPAGRRFRARLALLSDGTLAAHPETRPPDRLQGF